MPQARTTSAPAASSDVDRRAHEHVATALPPDVVGSTAV